MKEAVKTEVKRNKVVWIDDDPIYLSITKSKIEETQKPFVEMGIHPIEFIFFQDIEEAMGYLEEDAQKDEHEVCLIILDQNMSEITGIDMSKKIHTNPKIPNYRFAICTGEVDRQAMAQSLRMGSLMFLYKEENHESLYIHIVHMIQHVNRHEEMSTSWKRKSSLNIASGIIAKQVGITTQDAKDLINRKFHTHPEVDSIRDFCDFIIDNHNQSVRINEILEIGC